MIKSFLFLLIISSILLGQGKSKLKYDLGNDYTSIKLIKGVPSSLKDVDYFSHPDKISYVEIYNNNESLYFILKKINPDSNIYIMVLTSNEGNNPSKIRINDYDYLSFRNINCDSLFATSNILSHNNFIIDLYYLPQSKTLLYQITKNNSETQANFELGIRDELILMFANLYSRNTMEFGIVPINIHLTTGVRFLKNYKIDTRYGLMIVYEDFEGFDAGIFFQADLFKSSYYGVVGIDHLFAMGSSHNSGSTGDSFNFVCLGFGYSTSKNFSLDLMYYIPTEKTFGYDFDFTNLKSSKKIDNGLIKIGFQYSFIF